MANGVKKYVRNLSLCDNCNRNPIGIQLSIEYVVFVGIRYKTVLGSVEQKRRGWI